MPADRADQNPWTRPPAAMVPPPDLEAWREAPTAPPPAEASAEASPGPRGMADLAALVGAALVVGVGIGVALSRIGAPAAPEPTAWGAPAPTAPTSAPPIAAAAIAPAAERASPPPRPPPSARPATAKRSARAPAPKPKPKPKPAQVARRVARPAPRPPARVYAEDLARAPPPEPVLIERPAFPVARDDAPCGWAQSKAQRLVCEDRGLARADQRLKRAYDAALAAGAAPAVMSADQEAWRRAREDAAGRSRRAVAKVYDQRIKDLEAMAPPR